MRRILYFPFSENGEIDEREEKEVHKYMSRTDIKSMSEEELKELLLSMGEKSFRAAQIFSWIHEKKAETFDDMTNLSRALREKLKEECELIRLNAVEIQKSRLDGTRKYAFALPDGNIIESVWMEYKHGNSVCISSQVGCRMGCRFCASTLDGLERNLRPSEMLEQIYEMERDTGQRVSNIVVMGTGEPLDNLPNLLRFLELITSEKGSNISQRNITVSTCGLVPKIRELAAKKLQITLAISLHAPNDELRRTMMPIAKSYSIHEIMDACDEYFAATGRRISFEYSLVRGVNDGEAEARQLIALLKGRNCHVNLIPVNPIKERDYKETLGQQVEKFQKQLEKNGINATIRRRLGTDIDSACGQLRRRVRQEEDRKEAESNG